MKYDLPKGTKIIFPDTQSNRDILMCGEEYEDSYVGFDLGVVYQIAGEDAYGCYFFDGAGDRNYAGRAADGSDGVFEIVG